MTAEQSIVGAMGCASWRAHRRVREYAQLAPSGGLIAGGPVNAPRTAVPGALSLNEVGVTDAVMATLWRFGPSAATFAVTAGAESNHLGADIAIMHTSTSRILLYQAKLGHLDANTFRLKSKVTASQAKRLRRQTVTIDGQSFSVTGRIAIYQADDTPFLQRCDHYLSFEWWHRWHHPSQAGTFAREPKVARWYYEEVIRQCGCSPSGVVAATVPSPEAIHDVTASTTWPWEFDIHHWLGGRSPLDSATSGVEPQVDDGPPEFEPYEPTTAERLDPEATGEVAQQLAQELRLPASFLLYLIQV